MGCTMNKDADAIRKSLEALGYSGVQFGDSFGFITAIGVHLDGQTQAVTGPMYGPSSRDRLSDEEQSVFLAASEAMTRDKWVASVQEMIPLP